MFMNNKCYIESPPDDMPVMHYLNVYQLLSMLYNECIYFSSVTLYEDTFESTLSKPSYKEVLFHPLWKDNTPVEKDEYYCSRQKFIRDNPPGSISIGITVDPPESAWEDETFSNLIYSLSRHFMYTHCWAIAPEENILMWDRYRYHGSSVAIKSTINRMKKAFADSEQPLHIGKIQYKDYETEHITGFEDYAKRDLSDPDTVEELFYQPVFHKQNIYKSENEVRIVIDFKYMTKKVLKNTYLSCIPFYDKDKYWVIKDRDRHHQWEEDYVYFRISRAEYSGIHKIFQVKVDLDQLIKQIILSPYMVSYAKEGICGVLSKYGLDPNKVIDSSIELK